MLADLERREGAPFLSALARRLNPLLSAKHRRGLRPYYWTIRESEYATDVMFKSDAALKEVYPALVNQALRQFSCQDTMRFWGRKTNSRFSGEASTNVVRRPATRHGPACVTWIPMRKSVADVRRRAELGYWCALQREAPGSG